VAEFFLELFSEEIPARMQAKAAEDLARLLAEALAGLQPRHFKSFCGPRRIACAVELHAEIAASRTIERGPRSTAPEQALAGFLRKHGADQADIREEAGFFVLDRESPAVSAQALVAEMLPSLLRRFPWPKSMRWGGTSGFTWVRPLRRIICLFDGVVVPFTLRDGDDDGHGLVASNLTEGHRFLAPGAFAVSGVADWQAGLRDRHVIVDAAERRALIAEGVAAVAADAGYTVVDDPGLLDEVAGLVEWPVPLLGRIDAAFMDLPPEVMQVSMRVNQRYFALRTADGKAAPAFAFVANVPGSDGGKAIIAGNERVLSARFTDARHFWDLDCGTHLVSRIEALGAITFHAKLGSQGERVTRITSLAKYIATLTNADLEQTEYAARLAKADLTTGMVREFPELQGIMGSYYAAHDNASAQVVLAVREHYLPQGPNDAIPSQDIGVVVSLADKINSLVGFFASGERPTGSSDPYALRRAALGIIRIIRERNLRIRLNDILNEAALNNPPYRSPADVFDFLLERLRVQLRTEGARHDVLNAVLGAGTDDDIVRLLARTDAVAGLLGTEDGANLLAAYRRAANILRIEEKKDGPHSGAVDPGLLQAPEESALASALDQVAPAVTTALGEEDFTGAMSHMATLRPPLDAFFVAIQVNADDASLRENRLRLLARVRQVMNSVADFSKIDG
jgi:glycyl-tRNA synthetase beta chain